MRKVRSLLTRRTNCCKTYGATTSQMKWHLKSIIEPSLKNFLLDYSINTVKPLYSGHYRDREKVSAIERCPLHRGSSQICLFCSKNRYFATKTCFRVLGHCKIRHCFISMALKMPLCG